MSEQRRVCPQCGKPVAGKSSKIYCSRRCGHAAYRARNLDAVKKQIVGINGRRLKRDPAFRAKHQQSTRKWRAGVRANIAGVECDNVHTPAGPYRSRMEERLVPPLLDFGAEYEPVRLPYPQRRARTYTPDVVLLNGIVLEIKGWFTSADRTKMLAVKAEYPALDIRMVLASPQQKIGRASSTTQAAWCEAHGFPWAGNEVPRGWVTEAVNYESKRIIDAAPRRRWAKRNVLVIPAGAANA